MEATIISHSEEEESSFSKQKKRRRRVRLVETWSELPHGITISGGFRRNHQSSSSSSPRPHAERQPTPAAPAPALLTPRWEKRVTGTEQQAGRVRERASAFAYTGSVKKRAHDTVGSGKENATGPAHTTRSCFLVKLSVWRGLGVLVGSHLISHLFSFFLSCWLDTSNIELFYGALHYCMLRACSFHTL
jgi:hypothetical protein